LQCAIPVFEGLLPKRHNRILLDLLFELATWHGLAKLQLHTESTLRSLDHSTTRLGAILRKFKSTVCEEYDTQNLPSEEAARGRRKAAATAKKPPNNMGQTPASQKKTKARSFKKRYFNLDTYKLHSLGDYVKAIKRFGTTDNTSTQTVGVHFIPS
jgi:hypothetical protein